MEDGEQRADAVTTRVGSIAARATQRLQAPTAGARD